MSVQPSEGVVPAENQPAAATESSAANVPQDTDELEPQLKYERLGADVKAILQESSATCLCLSEKVLALGTSKGVIHILDYSGNEVNIDAFRTSAGSLSLQKAKRKLQLAIHVIRYACYAAAGEAVQLARRTPKAPQLR